mgnify:CR=1 FL=1
MQLQDILRKRAELAFMDGVVDPGVIEKCAALAAQEHGDARRALDLLRVSAELAERMGRNRVSLDCVEMAEKKLDVDRTTEIVRAQPKQSQAVLAAIIKLSEERNDIQTGDVFSIYERICARAGLKILTQRRVSDLIGELDCLGIININVVSRGRYGRTREIRLNLNKPVISKIKKILKENYLLSDSFMEYVRRNYEKGRDSKEVL